MSYDQNITLTPNGLNEMLRRKRLKSVIDQGGGNMGLNPQDEEIVSPPVVRGNFLNDYNRQPTVVDTAGTIGNPYITQPNPIGLQPYEEQAIIRNSQPKPTIGNVIRDYFNPPQPPPQPGYEGMTPEQINAQPQPDSLSEYWKKPVIGKIPRDQFVQMAGMIANALAPNEWSGRLGAALANNAGQMYQERMNREYNAPDNAIKRRLEEAQIKYYEEGGRHGGRGVPSSIAEYQWYNSLSPEEQKNYETYKNIAVQNSITPSVLGYKAATEMAKKGQIDESDIPMQALNLSSPNTILGRDAKSGLMVTMPVRGDQTLKQIPGTEGLLPKQPLESDVKFQREYLSSKALLDTLVNKFKEAEKYLSKNPSDRIFGYPARIAAIKLQTSPALASLEAAKEATLSKIIRSLGETGQLTDRDVERAKKAMPSINDTEDVRNEKFATLYTLTEEVFNRGNRGFIPMGDNTIQKEETPPILNTKTIGNKTYIMKNGSWYEQ